MSNTPVDYPLTIIKGRTFSFDVYVHDSEGDPIDITDWTGKAQIRKTSSPDADLLTSFVITLEDVATAKFTCLIATADTKVASDSGYWDLVLTNADGHSYSYLAGEVTFSVLPTV